MQKESIEKKTTVDENGVTHTVVPEVTLKVKLLAYSVSIVIPIINYFIKLFLTKLSM